MVAGTRQETPHNMPGGYEAHASTATALAVPAAQALCVALPCKHPTAPAAGPGHTAIASLSGKCAWEPGARQAAGQKTRMSLVNNAPQHLAQQAGARLPQVLHKVRQLRRLEGAAQRRKLGGLGRQRDERRVAVPVRHHTHAACARMHHTQQPCTCSKWSL